MFSPYKAKVLLKQAIREVAGNCPSVKEFSRKNVLTRDVVIRLLIGAERQIFR